MYEILVTEQAKKQLEKLDARTRNHIAAVIERMRIRPFAYVKAIVGSPYYRVRAGDYRAILDIRQSQLVILVLEVGHRKTIYK